MHRLLVFVVTLLAVLPGCQTKFVSPAEMPTDFIIGMKSTEAMDPPVDFRMMVERSGKAQWNTLVRSPRRKAYQGELELTESQVRALYDVVLRTGYDSLASEYSAVPGASNYASNGVRHYWVEAAGLDHLVTVSYMRLPAADELQEALVAHIPAYAFSLKGGPDGQLPPADRFVADRSTRRFHHPDCEHAQNIDPDKRETFTDWEDALNFKFDPCVTCKPMESR